MKVTLIHPGDRGNLMPPLGILYIGAFLRERMHNVQLFDPALDDESFIKEIVDFQPDIIGVSIGVTSLKRARKLLDTLKPKLKKDTIYCAGGSFATAAPLDILKMLDLDFVVIGEGEQTMLDACNKLSRQETLAEVKGIVYRTNNSGYVFTEKREMISDLDCLPFPARDLLDFSGYLLPPGLIRGVYLKRTTTILTGRGCPGRCIFCGSHLIFGRTMRRRTVANVIAEIEHLINDYQIEGIWFCDDTFTINPEWVRMFCQEVINRKIKFKWGCQARVDTVSEDLLLRMKEAGCVQLDFGIESGSNKVLKALKKGTTEDKIITALKLTKKVGLRTFGTVMLGNPDETKEDVKKTWDILEKTTPDFVGVGLLTPYPGTEIYKLALENNWVDPRIFMTEEWLKHQSISPAMCINFSKDELIEMKAAIQNRFCGLSRYKEMLMQPDFLLSITWASIKNPIKFTKGLRNFIISRNLNDLLELIAVIYRQDKAMKR